jgi:wyosine [tRNA(Phe)-imidazoG37] synthetase (radical SAM superfamily)
MPPRGDLPRRIAPGVHDYGSRRWVYTRCSGFARGLAVGVNLSPGGHCDYQCRYCRVPGSPPGQPPGVDALGLAVELEEMLVSIRSGILVGSASGPRLPVEWSRPGQVMLSGEGEPTLCPNFLEVVETLVHIRARGRHPFFRFILETNGSGLERADVREALGHFTVQDEVWLKLDAGTGERFHQISGSREPFERVLSRIADLGRQRSVVLQSLFAAVDGQPPARSEISAYLGCLTRLKDLGAMIHRVQIHSVTRSLKGSGCTHLPLGSLSGIARRVRLEVGLEAEVS